MKENFLFFISNWADKIIALTGITLYKVTSFIGLLFLTNKKKTEEYKVTIEKEKL
ncbi:MAG: hypothetical protein JSS90_05010 [Bacteroidetes bacterium]|jgi:hypothetical protein|nr:hypothetical protein [Bacteroidota bacterium]